MACFVEAHDTSHYEPEQRADTSDREEDFGNLRVDMAVSADKEHTEECLDQLENHQDKTNQEENVKVLSHIRVIGAILPC